MTGQMLEYPFMQSAFVMGLLLGTLFSLMGVFAVTRGMAFFSDFLSHSVILGGALALAMQLEPSLFLIPFSLVVALMVASAWQRMPLTRDTVLGVFYGGTVSFGILLVAWKGLPQQKLMQLLFGDILLISALDITLSAGLTALFILVVGLRIKRILKSAFLPEVAAAEGINVRAYDYLLIALMALTIAISVKVVGVLLANAMVVIPAAAAKRLSRNFKQFALIAPMLGILSFMLGIAGSFHLDLPSGPSVAAVAFIIFIATLPIRRGA